MPEGEGVPVEASVAAVETVAETDTETETEQEGETESDAEELPADTVESDEAAGAEDFENLYPSVSPDPVIGNPDMWELLCSRVSSGNEYSATYALEIPTIGCVVRMRLVSDYAIVSETSVFVPGASIGRDVQGGKKLVHPQDR